jgi:hypothetical protein
MHLIGHLVSALMCDGARSLLQRTLSVFDMLAVQKCLFIRCLHGPRFSYMLLALVHFVRFKYRRALCFCSLGIPALTTLAVTLLPWLLVSHLAQRSHHPGIQRCPAPRYYSPLR